VQVEFVSLSRSAAAELADDWKADGKIVAVEGERPWRSEFGAVLDKAALGQAEQDLVRVVGGEEAAMLRRRGNGHALAVFIFDEDAVELRPSLFAAVDAQRQMLPELVELSDLDRGPERTGLEVEAQAFVAIVGHRLEVADDREVDRGEGDCIGVGDAEQSPVADADPAHRVQF
jgi:hypothetical protein